MGPGLCCGGRGVVYSSIVAVVVEPWWGLFFLPDNSTLFAAPTGVERGVTSLYSAHRRGLARAPALFLAQSQKTGAGALMGPGANGSTCVVTKESWSGNLPKRLCPIYSPASEGGRV